MILDWLRSRARPEQKIDEGAASEPSQELPPGTIGFIDVPDAEAIVGPHVTLSGWALDPVGVRGVEVRLDAHRFAARTGIARLDVARVKPGYPNGDYGGFEFVGDFSPYEAAPGVSRRKLIVVAIAEDGRETKLGERSLIEGAALRRWDSVAAAAGSAFHLLPALSDACGDGAYGLEKRYVPYRSHTTRIGMRVPILYLRTTRGAGEDFVFDPDFDLSIRQGARALADDNLSGVLRVAVSKNLPLLLTLNGGIWADASGDAPEWDLNDWLEQDPDNCQWNERGEVMPDDHLKHLPGSFDAPELARSLTFNVYAKTVRRYKKRNLQQAARHVAAFMREHPDLFVGVSVDPDTYLNPFFEETQWYDYNPGCLRQFREWLSGTGPYAGAPEPDVPDLRAYRRASALDLTEVRRLARRDFPSWDEVDPPHMFSRDPACPFWTDPWVREWELFRRHLVHLHYDELARWLVEAGIPRDCIWSAQGFMAPTHDVMPFALSLDSPVKDFDSGGMTIEGSKPSDGHLGAILYGASASNNIATENGKPLFSIFAAIDPRFAVVELNTADLRHPHLLPAYADGYRAFRDLWNAGARFISPMAWNGSSGRYAGHPDYVARTAWRETPLEDAACDFLLARAGLPLESLLWTFGTPRHADDDGWRGASGAISRGRGCLHLTPDAAGRIAIDSPPDLPGRASNAETFVLGLADASRARDLRVLGRERSDASWQVLASVRAGEMRETPAGIAVRRSSPGSELHIDQLRLELTLAPGHAVALMHVAVLLALA
jgi:hypothetical protein